MSARPLDPAGRASLAALALVGGSLLALVGTVVTARPAAAHAVLVSASPADGAQLD